MAMYTKTLSDWDKTIVDIEFGNGAKLTPDYANAYGGLQLKLIRPKINFESMKPVRNYNTYVNEAYPQRYAYTMSLSDPAAIAEVNQIVADFNTDLPRIKATEDLAAIKIFLEKIENLVRPNI
jgi:hypothetical protein